jgi:cyanate permease
MAVVAAALDRGMPLSTVLGDPVLQTLAVAAAALLTALLPLAALALSSFVGPVLVRLRQQQPVLHHTIHALVATEFTRSQVQGA